MERVGPELGPDDAGMHDADDDAGMRGAQLHAEVRAEGVQGMLRRRVRRADRRERDAPEHRGDVDDLPLAALAEVREHGLHPVERRLHVDAHHGVEVLVRELGDGARDASARVVHEHVDAPEALEGLGDDALEVGALRDVGDDDEGVRSEPLRDLLEQGPPAGDEDDAGALGDEERREGGSDARARSGDDDDAILHARNVLPGEGERKGGGWGRAPRAPLRRRRNRVIDPLGHRLADRSTHRPWFHPSRHLDVGLGDCSSNPSP